MTDPTPETRITLPVYDWQTVLNFDWGSVLGARPDSAPLRPTLFREIEGRADTELVSLDLTPGEAIMLRLIAVETQIKERVPASGTVEAAPSWPEQALRAITAARAALGACMGDLCARQWDNDHRLQLLQAISLLELADVQIELHSEESLPLSALRLAIATANQLLDWLGLMPTGLLLLQEPPFAGAAPRYRDTLDGARGVLIDAARQTLDLAEIALRQVPGGPADA